MWSTAPPAIDLCKVCHSRKPYPSVRDTQPAVCEACKKFFLRHRDAKSQQTLQCVTGRLDCDVTSLEKRVCAACRLRECFKIGMRFEEYPTRMKLKKRSQSALSADDREKLYCHGVPLGMSIAAADKKQKATSDDQNQYDCFVDLTPQPKPQQQRPELANSGELVDTVPNLAVDGYFTPTPGPALSSHIEDFLQKSLRALSAFSALETLPLRRSISNICTNEDTWWRMKLEHFQVAARSATAYVRQLPGFTTIPLSDRPVLFANALYPLLIADLALPSQPRGLSFLGIAESNRTEFLRYFSEFQLLSEDASRITEVFSSWQPTIFEFAILAALLFYEPCFSGLQRADLVRHINGQLRTALNVLLPRQCSSKEIVNWRLYQFEVAFEMLRRASDDHYLAIEMLARRRPNFVSMNHLFYEVFTHTQRAVTLMSHENGTQSVTTSQSTFLPAPIVNSHSDTPNLTTNLFQAGGPSNNPYSRPYCPAPQEVQPEQCQIPWKECDNMNDPYYYIFNNNPEGPSHWQQ